MRPSQTQDKFIVRLPDGMREQISEAAAVNQRSMTAEIVARLAWSFEKEGGEPKRSLEFVRTARAAVLNKQQEAISALEQRVDALETKIASLPDTT